MKHLQSWVVESTHHIFSVKDVHLYSGLSKTVLVNMQNKKYSCPGCSFEIQSPRWGRGCPQTRPDALRGTPQGQSHDRGPVQGHDQGRLGDSHLKPPDFFGDKISPLRTGLLLDNHLILSTAFLAEMKDRSSYQQSINVLKAISDGLGESEIKSGEGISRYSYQYVVNRLINAGLVEYKGDGMVLLRKGFNVLRFDGEKDGPEIEKAVQVVT